MGSVMSATIQIFPSRARGGWPVKRWEFWGTCVERGIVRRRLEMGVVVVVVPRVGSYSCCCSCSCSCWRGSLSLPSDSPAVGKMRNMRVW